MDPVLFFAGLARDCAASLAANLRSLHDLASRYGQARIFVLENDSRDETRTILQTVARHSAFLELICLDGLDAEFPHRESRIAHCRNLLLDRIRRAAAEEGVSLYIPIDLDSAIARSIEAEPFLQECRRVAAGEVDAVFPVSTPFYYDVYALRAKGWQQTDCWEDFRRDRVALGGYRAATRHVYAKQWSSSGILSRETNVPVESAFGGYGIYNLAALPTDATYAGIGGSGQPVCEHVHLNLQIAKKEISRNLTVAAPREHIRWRLMNEPGRLLWRAKFAAKAILASPQTEVLKRRLDPWWSRWAGAWALISRPRTGALAERRRKDPQRAPIHRSPRSPRRVVSR